MIVPTSIRFTIFDLSYMLQVNVNHNLNVPFDVHKVMTYEYIRYSATQVRKYYNLFINILRNLLKGRILRFFFLKIVFKSIPMYRAEQNTCRVLLTRVCNDNL